MEQNIRRVVTIGLGLLAIVVDFQGAEKKKSHKEPSALDSYVSDALQHAQPATNPVSAGSLWSPQARLASLASDFRAAHVDDLITILVQERASAVASGTTKTARSSSAKASVNALGGLTRVAGPWANLADASSQRTLDGQGATSRDTTLTTTLSARVTQVLPNGYLVISGVKNVSVNAENQVITIRGVVRPFDVSTGNTVNSNQIANMEVQVNGKGIVNDAVKRPFILYRVLLGLLPF
jgi:flagellar L-ring protein FlgH